MFQKVFMKDLISMALLVDLLSQKLSPMDLENWFVVSE